MYNIRPQTLKTTTPPFRGRWGEKSFWFLCIMCLFMTSCEFFDIDEVGAETAMEMRLPQYTLYVMVGDTFSLNPIFAPDTVNITDLFFLPVYSDVVAVRGVDKLEAVGEGGTKIYITSVSARIQDSCMVYVSAPWVPEHRVWPYETVFYAHVTVAGQPPTENMEVGAFVGNECRAIGQMRSSLGVNYWRFRVGSTFVFGNSELNWDDIDDMDEEETDEDDDEDDEEGYIYRERITFRCYDRLNKRLYICPTRVDFDGEAHGSLSDLYVINF